MSQVKCQVHLSAVASDCCLGVKGKYYILIIEYINDFMFPYYKSCFIAT